MIHTVFDIETTGYNPLENDMLEFGYLRINDNLDILSYGTLYFYKENFDVECTTEITGLTRDFLSQYSNQFDENVCAVVAMLSRGNIIGKNSVQFDIPFINKWIPKVTGSRLSLGAIGIHDDMQILFAEKYRALMSQRGTPVSYNKRGTLGEYVDVLNLRDEVNSIYGSMKKDRETGFHGALYDSVATFLVYKNCKEMGLI